MTEVAATINGKALDARYTLLDKLGAGGQGEVWRAHDGSRGVDIALKVMHPAPGGEDAAWGALEHEYAIASRLNHPSILKVFPPERAGEAMVLPMELASGGDLRRLRGAGFLEIIPALLEIAQALEHAHERGVVHRDLKPGNVLFDARGRARLADFGVAETAMTPVDVPESGASTSSTRDTNRHGFSPFTASPAQLRGEPPTPADDVYGLGALAYELLSGYPPYYPHFDKKRAIEDSVPPLVPTRQIPPLLGALVTRMLEKDPKQRPRSMRQVIDELDAALNDTLTFDFETVTPSAGATSAASASAADGAADAAGEASDPAKPFVWTPASRDRRSSPDRRGRRREDMEGPLAPRDSDAAARNGGLLDNDVASSGAYSDARTATESVIARSASNASARRSSDRVGAGSGTSAAAANRASKSNGAGPHLGTSAGAGPGTSAGATTQPAVARTTPRTGAEAPSRIDAHLEQSPNVPASPPKLPHRVPLTPAKAAAIVAAARAAAQKPALQSVPAPGHAGATTSSTANGASGPHARSTPAPIPAAEHPAGASSGDPYDSAPSSLNWKQADTPASKQVPTGVGAWPARPAESHSGTAGGIGYHPTTTHWVSTTPTTLPAEPVSAPAGGANSPTAGHPAAAHAAAAHPSTAQPGATEPSAGHASVAQPAAARPSAAHPTAMHATPAHPIPAHPTAMHPTPVPPTSVHPTSAPPAPAHPTTAHSINHANPTPPHAATAPQPPLRTMGDYAESQPIHAGPMHATWEIPLEGLPKVARLQPIPTRRWPWLVIGLMAGAAAAVYFWLPRFDTDSLPPEVAAVVQPLQAAITSNSTASPTTAAPVATASASGAPGAPGVAAASGPTGASGATRASGVGVNAGAAPTATTPGASASHKQATPAATNTTSAANTTSSPSASNPSGSNPSGSNPSATTASDEHRLRTMRFGFDNRLASLEARGAGVWGGREFAAAKTRAAESVGARDAGNPRLAQERLAAAIKLLDVVESKAPQALSAQVAAGEKALGAGQQEVAGQAFDLARRISPADRRATDGQRRAQNLNAVLPLLADAQNAEVARDYARAAQDYSQALFLDPTNATAKAGQARANAAFGDDNYAKAIGSGFAALGAGRLDEAHDAFVKARALKPNGAEASEGLRRVGAALTARGFASMRQRAVGLEAQERWEEALRAYEDVLAADPSLAFAQEGKARSSSRAELSVQLQQLIDRPDRLASAGVREDAHTLLETARAQSPQGPVIRSQIARLEILLPGFDKPVRLSLLSDNSTQVVISSIGSFGAFARRDIELRPGKYTVVGTRNGFRDVRREITVAPGQDIQTIRVTCSEPI